MKAHMGRRESYDFDKRNHTARRVGLTAVDLTYLLLETEKALGVRVPEGCLRDYGFSTLNKIIDGMATTE